MFSQEQIERLGAAVNAELEETEVIHGQCDSMNGDQFYTRTFLSNEEFGDKNFDEVLTLYVIPCAISIAREAARLGAVITQELPILSGATGAVCYILDTKVPIRLTINYTIAHNTGEKLYNENGTPKMVENENGDLVQATKWLAGHYFTVDALMRDANAVAV